MKTDNAYKKRMIKHANNRRSERLSRENKHLLKVNTELINMLRRIEHMFGITIKELASVFKILNIDASKLEPGISKKDLRGLLASLGLLVMDNKFGLEAVEEERDAAREELKKDHPFVL